jgi:hypothetical protein
LNFLPLNFLLLFWVLNVLPAEVLHPQGAFDDSLLRAHHAFMLGVNHILSQNI